MLLLLLLMPSRLGFLLHLDLDNAGAHFSCGLRLDFLFALENVEIRDICRVDGDLGELAGQTVLERFLQSDSLVVITDPGDDALEVTQTSTVQADTASHPVLDLGHSDR